MIWLIGNKGMLGSDMELMLKGSGCDYIVSDAEVDITDYDQLSGFTAGRKISWIINCSAYAAVDKAEDEPELAYKINDNGVLNIAKIAREKDSVLIHFSTDYVFSGDKNGIYNEDDKACPAGIYGKSKLQGEKQVMDTLEKYFIFRISWLYGEFGNNFVYTMLRLFSEREEVRVVNDQTGSPTYTSDVVDLVLFVINNGADNFGIYHFTNDGVTTWYDFALKIYRLSKELGLLNKDVNILPIKTKEYPTKAKRPVNSCLEKEKIKHNLGIVLQPWEKSLRKFLSSKVKK
ncbi:MAG: dTDP-4-dehydrorhamnose reductase [Spirochaetes bacterium]|nr:dTDP-4-dehydrorhamnose reductase [Spirochaetota bacterium]